MFNNFFFVFGRCSVRALFGGIIEAADDKLLIVCFQFNGNTFEFSIEFILLCFISFTAIKTPPCLVLWSVVGRSVLCFMYSGRKRASSGTVVLSHVSDKQRIS